MPFGGLLTVGLISAGAGLASSAIQSHQASKAVTAQTDATDKAIALRQPYVDTGTKAFTTLGALMGLGGGGGGAAASGSTAGQTPAYTLTRDDGQTGSISDPNANGGNAAQAPGGGGLLNGTPGQVATNPNASSYPSYTPHSSPVSNVTMKAPDGSTQSVPADQIQYWTQKGATVVS